VGQLLNGMALSLFAVFIVVSTGGALLSFSSSGRKLTGVELLALSAAMGVMVLGILGIATVSVPVRYEVVARVGFAILIVIALLRGHKTQLLARLRNEGGKSTAIALGAWILAAWTALAVTLVPVKFPAELPDGAYVIKNHSLPVKIQRTLGDFPADNYIPYVAGEYLLRDIQFADERPLMPGQELSNRPILMSLATIPFRAALQPVLAHPDPLPKFRYVGLRWPDVGSLGSEKGYWNFLAVAVTLNATLILGMALLLQRFRLDNRYSLLAYMLFLSSPYFLGETLFAWPKSLAGFFLIVAGVALWEKRSTLLVGLLSGLAYWSHPYAIIFVGCIALYLIWRERNDSEAKRGFLPFAIAAATLIIPWFLWTRLYLNIPSDLVQQNFVSNSVVDALWARLVNIRNIFLPPPEFWSSPDAWCRVMFISLVGAFGVCLIPPVSFASLCAARKYPVESLLGVVLPALLITGVFSGFALPALHGMQPIAVLFSVLALWWMRTKLSFNITLGLVLIQLVINVAMLGSRALVLVS